MFDEGRRKWRSPGGDLTYLLERLLLVSRFGERRRQQGFDGGVFAAPRGSFQRRDRLGGPVLHQQRLTKDPRCKEVAAVSLQHVAGNAPGFVGALHLQRKYRALKRLVGGVRPFGEGWR